jgi:hypothetical protein
VALADEAMRAVARAPTFVAHPRIAARARTSACVIETAAATPAHRGVARMGRLYRKS